MWGKIEFGENQIYKKSKMDEQVNLVRPVQKIRENVQKSAKGDDRDVKIL
jgi:hypothetical protein